MNLYVIVKNDDELYPFSILELNGGRATEIDRSNNAELAASEYRAIDLSAVLRLTDTIEEGFVIDF